MNLQRLLMFAISLTPLLLAGLIWNLSIDNSRLPVGSASSDDVPDSLLSALTLNQFDSAGNLVQQLVTANAISHVAGEEIELTQPRLFVTGENQTRWAASSESGYLDRPGSLLKLQGDVLLRRLGAVPAQLSTESLIWLPASASAYTDDLVVIDAPGSRMQSEGITIDLDRSNFNFHSKVRGIHEPL